MPDDLRPSAEARALQGDCPVRPLLDRIADKWSLLIILHLSQATGLRQRFSELMRGIGGISQRMLTVTLRNLERDGLVTREIFAEVPPRVEYELTPRGQSLLPPTRALIAWLEETWPDIQISRAEYDSRTQK